MLVFGVLFLTTTSLGRRRIRRLLLNTRFGRLIGGVVTRGGVATRGGVGRSGVTARGVTRSLMGGLLGFWVSVCFRGLSGGRI